MKKIKIVYEKLTPMSSFSIDFPSDSDNKNLENTETEIQKTQPNDFDASMQNIHDNFVNANESNLFITPFVIISLVSLIAKVVNKDLYDCLEKKAEKVKTEDNKTFYEVDFVDFEDVYKIIERLRSTDYALNGYTRGIVIQLSTQFDILIASLVKLAVKKKPSVMEASERKVDFSELDQFSDIDELKQHFLDKTVETVVRKKRSDQFAWLSEKLGIPLTKNLDGWAEFIEVNERRNLFTHTEGLVTKEYITNCRNSGFDAKNLNKIGEELTANKDYIAKASELFFIIGVKLIQVVWRKLGGSCEFADRSLISLGYELNRSEKYSLSAVIGSFACGEVVKRYHDDTSKRVIFINYAASLVLSGDKKKAGSVLAKLDWSASSIEYQIAVAALQGKVKEVCWLMEKAVRSDLLKKTDLEEWPVFFPVRNEMEFKNTFEKIFNEKYIAKKASKQIDTNQRSEILEQMKRLMSSQSKSKKPGLKNIETGESKH